MSQKNYGIDLATLMCNAAAFGDVGRMEELLAVGASVDAKAARESAKTPLIYAVESGEVELAAKAVDWLVGAGADMEQLSALGVTALMSAAAYNRDLAIKRLACHGANLEKKGPDGSNALHMAANWNSVDAIAALLEAGADPLALNQQGRDPLSLCQDERGKALLLSAKERALMSQQLAQAKHGSKAGAPRI
jgi:ankyrin repeat protein